ncbi:hypothetical protein PGT21_011440 [Puccinia graminis f. sp. tritici]|uniref:Uncharacterized protein n=1 Tax=Puccinia graminis f. sp. tritici TaxID=56615 RepID=A0A5B0MUI9_PUCGR|nr:hypothetical protein PGT21_011440 [Puccinia graminis f. sp. tritici]KAA1131524.1 hypothetical protein PGTUg99_024696 [Puccinia graminis f. sp. tritici]
MLPVLKIMISIMLTGLMVHTKQFACPKEGCSGYSLQSEIKRSKGTPAICNTMTICAHHDDCCRCQKKVPEQYHICALCQHRWTKPLSDECPRLKQGNDYHFNLECPRPDAAAAA